LYVEDLKRGTNKEVGPKDIFELGSGRKCEPLLRDCHESKKYSPVFQIERRGSVFKGAYEAAIVGDGV
jgi:hypothetical protein